MKYDTHGLLVIKIINGNTKKRCKIYSKLTWTTSLTLSKYLFAETPDENDY